jgi:hypothetical protein
MAAPCARQPATAKNCAGIHMRETPNINRANNDAAIKTSKR